MSIDVEPYLCASSPPLSSSTYHYGVLCVYVDVGVSRSVSSAGESRATVLCAQLLLAFWLRQILFIHEDSLTIGCEFLEFSVSEESLAAA